MNSRTIIIAAVLMLGIAGLGAATMLPSVSSGAAGAATAESRTATFAIANMTCAVCPITVRTAMRRVAGVAAVEVDFEAKTATVRFDPAVATQAQIAAASTNAGYPARLAGH